MDAPKKVPPEKLDALTQRLQGSLQRRRPRTWPIVLAVLLLAVGCLALLAWWLYNPVETPRLEVVAFDAITGPDEVPQLRAQLAFPDDKEHPRGLLHGQELVFVDAKAGLLAGDAGIKTAPTDAEGSATTEWPRLAAGTVEPFAVRYVDKRNKQGSADQANLFAWPRGGKILLVDVEDTLAQLDPARWDTTHPAEIQPRPDAGRALREAASNDYRVAYLALRPTQALAYRKERGWVQAPRAERDRFPPGPTLGRPAYPTTDDSDQVLAGLLQDLKARLGAPMVLVANRAATIAAGQAAGARVIRVGAALPAAAAAGVVDVPDWSELPTHLQP